MYLGEIIKKYRQANDLTMGKFAELSGLSKGYISMLERNQNPQNSRELAPSIDTFKKVASVMNIGAEDLIKMTDKEQRITLGNEKALEGITNLIYPSAHAIPILGEICAGNGVWCEENFEGYFYIDKSIKADMCLEVKGDSMIEAGINNGDYAFIKKDFDYLDGRIYAVRINSDCEAVLKKVNVQGETIILSPCNTQYEPIIDDCNNVSIIGECVGVYHAVK